MIIHICYNIVILNNLREIKMKLYLDMDGVVANFFDEFDKVTGIKHKDIKDQVQFSEIMEKYVVGTNFFETLPKFNSVNNVLTFIKTTFNDYTILSSPLSNDLENTINHKKAWVKKHLKLHLPSDEIYTHEKHLYAKGNILIDDFLPNLEKWVAAGGIGIKYKAKSEKYDSYDLLRALKELKEMDQSDFKAKVVYLYQHVAYND